MQVRVKVFIDILSLHITQTYSKVENRNHPYVSCKIVSLQTCMFSLSFFSFYFLWIDMLYCHYGFVIISCLDAVEYKQTNSDLLHICKKYIDIMAYMNYTM